MSRKSNTKKRSHRSPSAAARSFEKSLLAFENDKRPANYPGLTAETRRRASNAQFLTFHEKYWDDWRHSKLRAYRFLLTQREAFLACESKHLSEAGLHPQSVIYQEFTNGLMASAVSEVCQYAEDLSLLSAAADSDSYFARDLASGHAGRIQQRVLSWKGISEEAVAKLLHIPWFSNRESVKDTEVGHAYLGSLKLAQERVQGISAFYKAWQPHFMRYKHGLLLALRFASGTRDDAFVSKRREKLSGFPVIFDCGSIVEAIDSDGHRVLIFPDVSERSADVKLNAVHLARERNLLRMVFPPRNQGGATIDQFIEIAAWISQCQRVLLENRRLEISPEPGRPFHVLHEDPAATLAVYRENREQCSLPTPNFDA